MMDERRETVESICRGIFPTFERDKVVNMILNSELTLSDLGVVKSISICNLTSENCPPGARYPSGLSDPMSGEVWIDPACLDTPFWGLVICHEVGHILYSKRGLRLSQSALSRISSNWKNRFKDEIELTVDSWAHAVCPGCLPDLSVLQVLRFIPKRDHFVTNKT